MVVELINKSLIDALIVVLFLPVVCFGENRFINEIPDFTQTDVKEINSGNGQQYCAPVAVSNSIAWMSGTENKQLRLITRLASTNYMNTSLRNGTGTSGVLRGVDKISRELFGGFKTLIYQGWRKHPKSYSSGKIVPDISKLKSAVTRKSAAWLNIGWYKYNKQSNEYRRYGGHWVTLVGDLDDQLILHDPAPAERQGRLKAEAVSPR
ncbi:MAG: hypothetical protein ABW170_04300 [Candidatus Thiodiazotropha sp. L084R]